MSSQLITFENLSKYNISDKYTRDGKSCILDPIREILIVSTPEEVVRQKVILYFLEILRVPKHMIEIEVPMSRFKKGDRNRADIVVYGNRDGEDFPLLIVECKAPSISITDDTWEQILKYDKVMEPAFLVVTNTYITEGLVWHLDDNEFKTLDELPNYERMCSLCDISFSEEEELWGRPDFDVLLEEKNIQDFYNNDWLGVDTNDKLIPFVMNLGGFIQDDYLEIDPITYNGIKIVKSGLRGCDFGNAAGGSWSGFYRYFIIEDQEGNNQIISFSVMGKLKTTNHPKWGNTTGSTMLIVAIDNYEKRHNSLQLNIDKYVQRDYDSFILWHDGTLTKGKSGAVKRSQVIEYIKIKAPELIKNNRIELGQFERNIEIRWNQSNTKDIIMNLIKYALLRDEFRGL